MGFLTRIASEAAYLRGAFRTLRRVAPIAKNPNHTFRELAEDLALRFGERPALISERETFTYREWNARANRYARWAAANGIAKGDVVALLMPNRAEYISIWLGIGKAGGITALLNTNLEGGSLAHCITSVGAKILIVDATLLATLERLPAPIAGLRLFVHGESEHYPRVDVQIGGFSDANLSGEARVPLTVNDKCLYIFTSGTTGMPKAANVNHYRLQLAMLGFSGVAGATENDRMYDCLPMYHTAGGVCAPGMVLTVGGSCVLREKFSAREFWSDVAQHKCTLFAYIGEMCRYLVHTPPGPHDRAHHVRLCIGNGLRPDIWAAFRDRFQLPRILEFYAATEGNITLFNFDSKPGAVGRIAKWAEHKFIVAIVRVDVETQNHVRDAEGVCIECEPGEIGEALGEILSDPARPGSRFEGYADDEASRRKIAHDVRKRGDSWFRSGDLMYKDAQGYFYFVDRIGDTFRWKGENVSTSEVAETIATFPGVREATVYGVEVPGSEGRVGMAAMVLHDPARFDLAGLHAHLARHLPFYARPRFLRLRDEIEKTGTFKQRKVDLLAEGFDPSRIADPLYVDAGQDSGFMPVDALAYERILAGAIRL